MPLKSLFYGHYAVTSPENHTLVQNKLPDWHKEPQSIKTVDILNTRSACSVTINLFKYE